jgi:hypothetical protein
MPSFGAGGIPIPGKYDAYLGTRLLVSGSRQPFLDGCRELLRLGFDPGAIVTMKRIGSETEALRGQIGTAAKLTVDESDMPRLRRWKAFRRGAVEPSAAKTTTVRAEGHSDVRDRASAEVAR